MKFKEIIISEQYAIASFVGLDEAIASGEDQSLVYYNRHALAGEEIWCSPEKASVYLDELSLFQGLLDANKEPVTNLEGYEPFAVCYELRVKQVDKVYTDKEVKQLKRAYALEKLTDEDKQLLGLEPYDHDVF